MAVSISTITKSVGWARSDVILALEEAFEIVEFHGDTKTGIITFVSERSGGELSNSTESYYNVEPTTSSGIGTGATFNIDRNSGSINRIYVNRPGYGYVDGEYLTFDPSLIGGAGATGLGITVRVAGNNSPISFGSTTTFYQKNVGVGTQYPFGVLRHEIESGKKYGTTYRGFQVWSDYGLTFAVGTGFHPHSAKYTGSGTPWNNVDGDSGYQYRFAGEQYLDTSSDQPNVTGRPYSAFYSINDSDGFYPSDNNSYSAFRNNQVGSVHPTSYDNFAKSLKFATTNSPSDHDLKLRVYQSSIDSKFAVFSFSQPTIAGSSIDDNVFLTFFLHNYTSSLWDYDYCYNPGITFIRPQACTNTNGGNYSRINFDTLTHGNFLNYRNNQQSFSSMYHPAYLRSAFVGYMSANSYADTNPRSTFADQYQSTMSATSGTLNDIASYISSYHYSEDPGPNAIYARTSTNAKATFPTTSSEISPTELDYNAVVKGIPVCSKMIPCPYYLPDDFVLIDFKYAASETNLTQGDTITISNSEVYEIIHASYNQYTETSGIAFCARKV